LSQGTRYINELRHFPKIAVLQAFFSLTSPGSAEKVLHNVTSIR
jgi:hypothetical protein